nr:DUF1365 domain-containing protein [Ramlibacter albus]
MIATGDVRHARLRPVRHAFRYPSLFVLLPLRSWRGGGALARNRFAPLSFHDADHGDGRGDALSWIDGLLRSEGIDDATGEVWLQCFPRVFGYAFKPVSFWYCERADGRLRAIVAEVNNTFGDRHCYLLDAAQWGRELQARKVFHVSPFCAVEGGYRFRFLWARERQRIVVRIAHDDATGPLLETSVSGELQPLTAGRALRAWLRFPLHGLGVVARIHWHALRLWLAGVPFFRRPAPPVHGTSRQKTA